MTEVLLGDEHRSIATRFIELCTVFGWGDLRQRVLEQLGATEQAESARACGCRDWPTSSLPFEQLWPRSADGEPTGHHPACALYREPPAMRVPKSLPVPVGTTPAIELEPIELVRCLDIIANFTRLKAEFVRYVLTEVAQLAGLEPLELAQRAVVFPGFEAAVFVPGRGSAHRPTAALRLALQAVVAAMQGSSDQMTLEAAEVPEEPPPTRPGLEQRSPQQMVAAAKAMISEPITPEPLPSILDAGLREALAERRRLDPGAPDAVVLGVPADAVAGGVSVHAGTGPAYAKLRVTVEGNSQQVAWAECKKRFRADQIVVTSVSCDFLGCEQQKHALDLVWKGGRRVLGATPLQLIPPQDYWPGQLLTYQVDNLEKHPVTVELVVLGNSLGTHTEPELVAGAGDPPIAPSP